MGSFATSDEHKSEELRPLRVAVRREDVYAEARSQVADLAGWSLLSADDSALVIRCERRGGLLGGAARVTIMVEGPEGIPSATVHVRSESDGGLFSRDRSAVLEFLRPFRRRIG
jgi:hypothetical protein